MVPRRPRRVDAPLTNSTAPCHSTTPPLLLFEHVSKWYGPVLGVNQVTLELRSGITGLVGRNGAGKSTLLRLATGQLRPDLGRVDRRGPRRLGLAREAARRLLPRRGRLLRRDVRPPVRRDDGPAVRLPAPRPGGGPGAVLDASAWRTAPIAASAATRRACGSGSSWPPR